MDEFIKTEMMRGLGSGEIYDKLNKKVRIISYKQLSQFNNLDEVLSPFGRVIILYEIVDSFGHWTCVFRRGKGEVEFFDSYSGLPDSQFRFIDKNFKTSDYGTFPLLTSMLYESGYKIFYNDVPLQSKNRKIATCGHFCVLRLIFSNVNEYEFANMWINKKFSPDYLVMSAYQLI